MITLRTLINILAVMGCMSVVCNLVFSFLYDVSKHLTMVDYGVAILAIWFFAVKIMGEIIDAFYPPNTERD